MRLYIRVNPSMTRANHATVRWTDQQEEVIAQINLTFKSLKVKNIYSYIVSLMKPILLIFFVNYNCFFFLSPTFVYFITLPIPTSYQVGVNTFLC